MLQVVQSDQQADRYTGTAHLDGVALFQRTASQSDLPDDTVHAGDQASDQGGNGTGHLDQKSVLLVA